MDFSSDSKQKPLPGFLCLPILFLPALLVDGPLPPVVGLDEPSQDGAEHQDRGQARVGDGVILGLSVDPLAKRCAQQAEHLRREQYSNFGSDMSSKSHNIRSSVRLFGSSLSRALNLHHSGIGLSGLS